LELFSSVIISWLELKNLFQTFEPINESKIEEEIQDIHSLLDMDESSGEKLMPYE